LIDHFGLIPSYDILMTWKSDYEHSLKEKYGALTIEEYIIKKIIRLECIDEFVRFCKDLFLDVFNIEDYASTISPYFYEERIKLT
jgi:hypothetical protein